jgi:hypothetical protein
MLLRWADRTKELVTTGPTGATRSAPRPRWR